MITSYGSLLGLSFHERIDLDVFLSNADDYLKFFITPNKKCCFFQNFAYTQDIFAAFSSILMRIYLNLCFDFFSYLDLKLIDQRKIRDVILKQGHYLFASFWHEVNIDFFYEFFDIFDKHNLSCCFKNSERKLEFGPYHPSSFDATLTIIGL